MIHTLPLFQIQGNYRFQIQFLQDPLEVHLLDLLLVVNLVVKAKVRYNKCTRTENFQIREKMLENSIFPGFQREIRVQINFLKFSMK